MKNHVIGFLILSTIVTTTAFLSINNVNARDSDYEDLPGDDPQGFPPHLHTWCGSYGADPDNCKPKPQVYCEAKDGEWNAKKIDCEGLNNSEYEAYRDALCDNPRDTQAFGQICLADEIKNDKKITERDVAELCGASEDYEAHEKQCKKLYKMLEKGEIEDDPDFEYK